MAKRYDRLGAFLDSQTRNCITLSFEQIENIIHRKLPESARTYSAWWSNSPVEGRHNETWLKLGWKTAELDLSSRTVSFIRGPSPTARQIDAGAKVERRVISEGDQMTIPQAAQSAATHEFRLIFEWQRLGHVVLDTNGSLLFPSVMNRAGLYRLRLDGIGRSQVYIGESLNLRRRFRNYRGPGPTQQTSLRINALLLEAIADGTIVAVDIVTEGVKLILNGSPVSVDLSDKAIRGMIENAAIVASRLTDIEIVNR